jgi:hypothetical protein
MPGFSPIILYSTNRKTPGILIVIEFKLEEFIANGNSIADMSGKGSVNY